jgi:hypothetical protein
MLTIKKMKYLFVLPEPLSRCLKFAVKLGAVVPLRTRSFKKNFPYLTDKALVKLPNCQRMNHTAVKEIRQAIIT